MSADKEATKNGDMEVEGASSEENPDTPESKPVSDSKDSDESPSKGSTYKETPKKKSKGKDSKKYDVKDEDEENGESDENDDGRVPLLDQPLEMSGTRERKKVQRFTEEYKVEVKEIPIEIPEGKGIQLGNITLIDANIQKYKGDSLKPLHRLLFNKVGKATLIKKNIRKFSGFDFDEKSEQYARKKQVLLKVEVKVLKEICSVLNLKKSKKREELVDDILHFLLKPEGSEEPIEKKQKRASRTSKSYSESDDEDKRPKSRRGKMKRVSLKEVSTDEEDFVDEKVAKESDEENSKKKEKKPKESVKNVKEDEDDDEENENENEEKDGEEEDEEDEVSSEDSEGPKSKRGKGRGGKKNSKPSVKKSNAKKAPPKKTEKKPAPKKRAAKSDDESSEDEPLVKKGKDPPTDEEIKSYVKQILEGANLEETTMKIVCKQVYAHYPEFDLAHKKDFIKETVKSLIQP